MDILVYIVDCGRRSMEMYMNTTQYDNVSVPRQHISFYIFLALDHSLSHFHASMCLNFFLRVNSEHYAWF